MPNGTYSNTLAASSQDEIFVQIMILEILTEIKGNLLIDSEFELLIQPYTIKVFNENQKFYISIKKRIYDYVDFLPKMTLKGDKIDTLTFPSGDFFQDITQLFQHIESFGSLDIGIERIFWEEPTVRWIPENESEHLSPIKEYKAKKEHQQLSNFKFTEKWLSDTLIHRNFLADFSIPFSFFRDGINLFQETRYQAAFCSFYFMLEYFFSEDSWGIKDNAFKRDKCLKICLTKSLEIIKGFDKHYSWLNKVLQIRQKKYDEEGLLYIINRFRNELSHASNKLKNRNVFNDSAYYSLSFIAIIICRQVSIKKRLLKFVREQDQDSYLDK